MINFILFTFVVGVFAGGFWCGQKYQTFAKLGEAIVSIWK